MATKVSHHLLSHSFTAPLAYVNQPTVYVMGKCYDIGITTHIVM
jgi:hypothetical protein